MSENRLSRETSPYLLQHKDNPVHWWAWGPEALEEAKRTGKPILLSVGYAACHWCHVMAHESFEDAETAAVMNRLYVNIKVDREERPDVDALYMGALHRLGEQGGWPLTMFLDSDARPFFGGTYFPPTQRYGRPSFRHVLVEIARTFAEMPERVEHNAAALVRSLADQPGAVPGFAIDLDTVRRVAGVLTGAMDFERGGMRGQPKFPQWNIQWLLWRAGVALGDEQAKRAVETTLTNICQGGIYDHVGGGFARYSVDDRWLVPHFEKMLYDNALLIDLMTEVWRDTQDPLLRTRVLETVDWLQREMIAEGGGFAASLDADSEGEEGKFYVWTEAEVYDVLGPELGPLAATVYGVEAGGNFEGHTILNRLDRLELLADADEARLKEARQLLLTARSKRVRPGWDDKVLADWNGLMIAALARASTVFEEPSLLAIARRAFTFVTDHMTRSGRLMHSARGGVLRAAATSSDYANMIWAALRLHEATLERAYLDQAVAWASLLDRHYRMPSGGYALSADDTTDVIVRLVTGHDDAVPNANAIHLGNLVHLFLATGDVAFLDRAAAIPAAFANQIARGAAGHAGLVAAALDLIEPRLIVVLEPHGGSSALREVLRTTSAPGALTYIVSADRLADPPPALDGKTATAGQATAYLCLGPQCSAPITAPDRLRSALSARNGPS